MKFDSLICCILCQCVAFFYHTCGYIYIYVYGICKHDSQPQKMQAIYLSCSIYVYTDIHTYCVFLNTHISIDITGYSQLSPKHKCFSTPSLAGESVSRTSFDGTSMPQMWRRSCTDRASRRHGKTSWEVLTSFNHRLP